MVDQDKTSMEIPSTPPPTRPTINYPRLQPRTHASVPPEDYIMERINDAIEWYDKSASKNKDLYLRVRAITVIGGALVPVFVNSDIPYIDILTTTLSLIVVLLVSLESVYHFREQWTNYRSTEQTLRSEYFLFTSKSGAYGNLDPKQAYQHFVERVEEIIGMENASTLKILSSLTEYQPKTAQKKP